MLTNCHVFVKCSSVILVSGNDHTNCNRMDWARCSFQAVTLAILLHGSLVNPENVEKTVVREKRFRNKCTVKQD